MTRTEALAAGITPEELKQRVRRGALIPVHRGVYRVGHAAPSLEATYMAAVKAAGERAALDGRAAAHLYGLLPSPPDHPEVAAPTERNVKNVKTRRVRVPMAVTRYRGIAALSVPTVLVELAATMPEDELARAVHVAQVKFRVQPDRIERALAAKPTAKGAAKLRRITRGDTPISLSALESRFRRLVEDAGLPQPVMNHPAGTKRVDCRWPDHRLTVELDGYRFHNSRHAWEQDRLREREARRRGDDFRRFNHDDVFARPEATAQELSAALG